ncbi:MAG: aldehyde dehydrogenase family protein [Bradymonadales bacterium]
MNSKEKVKNLRDYFEAGHTLSYEWRRSQLLALREMIEKEEEAMASALMGDLRKPYNEAWLSEIGFVRMELDHALKRLKSWMKPRKTSSPLPVFLAKSYVQPIPRGVVLVISPWNYPLLLTLGPILSAVAAGNTFVLKPSEFAPNVSQLLVETLPKYLDPRCFAIVEGGPEETQELLKERFDYIFFTGSTATAKHIARAAAEHLTPCTLELGGKSPCVVWDCADMEVSARRIVWAKFTNAGQTCIAPDYVLVKKSEHHALLDAIRRQIVALYGENPEESADYARIINERHFDRLHDMLGDGDIVIGGQADEHCRYIAPTVLDNIVPDSRLRTDEIFGPILPIFSVSSEDEIFAEIAKNPEPLASYLYSKNKDLRKRMVQTLSTGGMCINDSLMHLANINLPFGGVGNSGMGLSHGKYSFDGFSHLKAVLHNSTKMDLSLRYPPYQKGWLKWMKRII